MWCHTSKARCLITGIQAYVMVRRRKYTAAHDAREYSHLSHLFRKPDPLNDRAFSFN